jgi:hypothetical protein
MEGRARARIETLLVCLTLLSFVAGPAFAEGMAPLQLITDEEADQPINTPIGRRFTPLFDGPAILTPSPTNGASYSGPISIHVTFEPGKNGLPVDMESLKLEYQRAWGIDITSRVRNYIEGEQIRIAEAALPKGRHSVEISIEDTNENLSALVFTVVVTD